MIQIENMIRRSFDHFFTLCQDHRLQNIDHLCDICHLDTVAEVLLFTVCLHHFLGSDLNRIYEELGQRFPDICFVRCYMDPIMQKHGLTPDQKLRKAMYDPLPERDADVTIRGARCKLIKLMFTLFAKEKRERRKT